MNFEMFPNITKTYDDLLASGDPRVSDWPMMDSPFPGITLVACYLGFVKVIGPSWMRDQKPFDLRNLMVVYNFGLVAVSAYMFVNFGMLGWFTTYSWRCQPVDYSNNPEAVKMAELGWYFYITKFIEFADTVFFVLRKKDSQISSLHVFHHSLVPITLWFGIKFGAGGYNSIFAFLNSFVHMWMYAYYGLSALGPSYQKYLWWKKYMTILQMVQFFVVFFYMLQLLFSPTCPVSRAMLYLNLVQAVIFYGLFLNFFVGSYSRRNRAQLTKRAGLPRDGGVEPHFSHKNGAPGAIRGNCARIRQSSVHNGTTARYTEVDFVTEAVTAPI